MTDFKSNRCIAYFTINIVFLPVDNYNIYCMHQVITNGAVPSIVPQQSHGVVSKGSSQIYTYIHQI